MKTRSWLTTVLRARQAQEDYAAQQLALARRDARRAAEQQAAENDRVTGMSHPDSGTQPAFQAAAAARQAAAATLAAATHRVMFAETRVVNGESGLTTAAKSRRTAEKLHERDLEASRIAIGQAAQRDLDEIAITRHGARRRLS